MSTEKLPHVWIENKQIKYTQVGYTTRISCTTVPNDCVEQIEYSPISELKAALAKAEKYRKALEFYGDPFSWRTRSGRIGTTPLTDGTDAELIDGQFAYGKLAREALKDTGSDG